MEPEADFIVIGAGAAGCLLANRLSADPKNRVVLLEAGPRDRNPLIGVPLLAGFLYYLKSLNWPYRTEPDPGLNGRSLVWPRGRVLGGSTAINGMMYMRGHRRDYDDWRQLGLTGWSYEDVLPLFKSFERNRSHPGAEAYHGRDGDLFTEKARGENPLYAAWLAAAYATSRRGAASPRPPPSCAPPRRGPICASSPAPRRRRSPSTDCAARASTTGRAAPPIA
jgi:choline dehydrogenase